MAGGVGVLDEQAVLALGQLEGGRGGGVDRGEGGAGVVHGHEAAAGGHTQAQAQGVFAGKAVVHQVAELVGVAVGAAGEETLAF